MLSTAISGRNASTVLFPMLGEIAAPVVATAVISETSGSLVPPSIARGARPPSSVLVSNNAPGTAGTPQWSWL
jgi:hypothetical protein